MKKIKDEIKILGQLREDCKTIESISQYKYSNYIKILKALNLIQSSMMKSILFENKRPSFIVAFISFFDPNLNIILKTFDISKVMIVTTQSVGKTYKTMFPNISLSIINMKKMRSLNTKIVEIKIMETVNDFLKKNEEDSISVYYDKKLINYGKDIVNNMKFITNMNSVSIVKFGLYKGFIHLLSLLCLVEYSNNSSAIKKINDLIITKKSSLRKDASKRNVYNLNSGE